MKLTLSSIFFIVLFVSTGSAKEPTWLLNLRQLRVLESNQADVERLFSSPKVLKYWDIVEDGKTLGKSVLYQTSNGHLEVDYSGGTCAELKSSVGYDVATGIITEMSFKPSRPLRSSLTSFDLDKFVQYRVNDVPGLVEFVEKDQSITVTIFKGKIEEISFGPPSKYDHLDCSNKEVANR